MLVYVFIPWGRCLGDSIFALDRWQDGGEGSIDLTTLTFAPESRISFDLMFCMVRRKKRLVPYVLGVFLIIAPVGLDGVKGF